MEDVAVPWSKKTLSYPAVEQQHVGSIHLNDLLVMVSPRELVIAETEQVFPLLQEGLLLCACCHFGFWS